MYNGVAVAWFSGRVIITAVDLAAGMQALVTTLHIPIRSCGLCQMWQSSTRGIRVFGMYARLIDAWLVTTSRM